MLMIFLASFLGTLLGWAITWIAFDAWQHCNKRETPTKPTDFERIKYLSVQARSEEYTPLKFLVVAMDGTSCWGDTFTEAVDKAMEHDDWLPKED